MLLKAERAEPRDGFGRRRPFMSTRTPDPVVCSADIRASARAARGVAWSETCDVVVRIALEALARWGGLRAGLQGLCQQDDLIPSVT